MLPDQTAINPAASPANFSRTRMYVVGTIISAGLAVGSILILALVKPENTSTGTLIMGIMLPIITAFLAASIGHLGAQIDGRLTQLLELTAKSSEAEGKAKEKDSAAATPNVPIPVAVVNTPTVKVERREEPRV